MTAYGWLNPCEPPPGTWTAAVMGDDPQNCERNADAFDDCEQYCIDHGFEGVEIYPVDGERIYPTDRVLVHRGENEISLRGRRGPEKGTVLKKYGTATSPVEEPALLRNGGTVGYGNAVLHIPALYHASVEGFCIRGDADWVRDSDLDYAVIVGEAKHAIIGQLYMKAAKRLIVTVKPCISTKFEDLRMQDGLYAAFFNNHQGCRQDEIYASRMRHGGLDVSLVGGYLTNFKVEYMGRGIIPNFENLGDVLGHEITDVPIAFGAYSCENTEITGGVGEENWGIAWEFGNNKEMLFARNGMKAHSSDYMPGAVSKLWATYDHNSTNCEFTMNSIDFAAFQGGATIDYHGTASNANRANVRGSGTNRFSGSTWGAATGW